MTHDMQVLLAIGVAGVVGFVLFLFVVLPVWDYVSELREYRAGKWRGEWSESRRLSILRYKRDQAIHYPFLVCLFLFLVGAVIQLARIISGAEGELSTLALLVVGTVASYRIAGRFDNYGR